MKNFNKKAFKKLLILLYCRLTATGHFKVAHMVNSRANLYSDTETCTVQNCCAVQTGSY